MLVKEPEASDYWIENETLKDDVEIDNNLVSVDSDLHGSIKILMFLIKSGVIRQ